MRTVVRNKPQIISEMLLIPVFPKRISPTWNPASLGLYVSSLKWGGIHRGIPALFTDEQLPGKGERGLRLSIIDQAALTKVGVQGYVMTVI